MQYGTVRVMQLQEILPIYCADRNRSVSIVTPENGGNSISDLSRLRWRCRRGMRELDQLLERWLRQRWAASSDAERGVFLRLLDSEDDRLWAWFMGHEEPPDVELAALIHTIGQLPP